MGKIIYDSKTGKTRPAGSTVSSSGKIVVNTGGVGKSKVTYTKSSGGGGSSSKPSPTKQAPPVPGSKETTVYDAYGNPMSMSVEKQKEAEAKGLFTPFAADNVRLSKEPPKLPQEISQPQSVMHVATVAGKETMLPKGEYSSTNLDWILPQDKAEFLTTNFRTEKEAQEFITKAKMRKIASNMAKDRANKPSMSKDERDEAIARAQGYTGTWTPESERQPMTTTRGWLADTFAPTEKMSRQRRMDVFGSESKTKAGAIIGASAAALIAAPWLARGAGALMGGAGLGGLGAVGNLFRVGTSGLAARAATTTAGTVAANTAGKAATSGWLQKIGMGAAGGLLVGAIGSYPFSGFLKEEALQTLGFGINAAKSNEDWDGAQQATDMIDEMLDPDLWTKIKGAIPYVNIIDKLDDFYDAAKLKNEIDKRHIRDLQYQAEHGESDEDYWKRIRQEQQEYEEERQRRNLEYWDEVNRRRAQAKADERAEEQAYWDKVWADKAKREEREEKEYKNYWREYEKTALDYQKYKPYTPPSAQGKYDNYSGSSNLSGGMGRWSPSSWNPPSSSGGGGGAAPPSNFGGLNFGGFGGGGMFGGGQQQGGESYWKNMYLQLLQQIQGGGSTLNFGLL